MRILTIMFFCRKWSKVLRKKFVIQIFFVSLQSQIREVYSVNLLSLSHLGVLEDIFKVIQQCYNQRKPNLEGSRKTA